MRKKLSGAVPMVAIMVAVGAAVLTPVSPASAQAPANSGTPAPAPKTPWGEPDLQGIWTDETDTPLQRPPKYANQEFFTEAQRAEIDKARSEILGRERRAARGTEQDVSGSYNNVFVSFKRSGARTSLIAQRPAATARASGAEDCRCRAGISSRSPAVDPDLQERGAGLPGLEI
jgi:hypothetical protein